MYLSRMYLNPERRGTRALLANPEKLHAAVLNACEPPSAPDQPAGNREKGRTMWRLDRTGSSPKRLELYTLSTLPPSFESLQEQAGWSQEQTWATGEYAKLLQSVRTGQHYAFRLCANPSYQYTDNNGVKKRRAFQGERTQLGWLESKQQGCGFRIEGLEPYAIPRAEPGAAPSERADDWAIAADTPAPAARVVYDELVRFQKRSHKRVTSQKKKTQVTLRRTVFQGVLEVTDADVFQQSLVQGIGRGKAYGCGLLTIAPISQG